jgi:hypothetical protein
MARVPDAVQCRQLEREDVGLLRIAQCATVADHRIRLLWFELIAAAQAAELVRAKVDRAVGDGPRRKPGRERRQTSRHRIDELVASALREQRARMVAVQRLEHHQLGAEQPDAVDVEPRRMLDLGGLRKVDEHLRPGDHAARSSGNDASRGSGWRRGCSFDHNAVRRIDSDDLAVAQLLCRLAGADDAGDTELA